jgi:hypothetical protein
VVVLFNFLQQMETWLHQHIFKVGWLVTKNFQTTTILYYTFFLPGVVLYELVRWMIAGVLDVRAEGAISLPEKQEIAELKLNFIKLHKKASAIKVRIINSAPPFVGLLLIYIIALNVYDIREMIETMQPGTLEAFFQGIGRLLGTADFVIWTYLVFTISNVTIPNNLVIRGWGSALMTAVLVVGFLLVVGFADEIYRTITPIVINGMNSLSTIFLLLMGINAAFTVILSAIENTIERITGDSAMFKNGKLIAMRREEIIAQREQERQKAIKAKQQKPALPAGPPSIYRVALPIPGAPGEVPVTQAPAVIVTPETPPALPEKPRREVPEVIESTATPATPVISAPPEPEPTLVINPPRTLVSEIEDDDEEEVEEDEIEILPPDDEDDEPEEEDPDEDDIVIASADNDEEDDETL